MRVALATCSALPGLALDDRRLLGALASSGFEVRPVVWEDPLAEWSRFDFVLVRSCWDYAYRRAAFVKWARSVERVALLRASSRLIEWNTHKSYLLELSARGVPTIPTSIVRRGEQVSLPELAKARGFLYSPEGSVVVKAAVAQTGRYLWHGRADDPAGQEHLGKVTSIEDALVQPFVSSIQSTGERSLVFVCGKLTHAVEKRADGDNVLVHDDFGGSVSRVEPEEDEVRVASEAIEACPEPPLYGRVDLVRGPDGPLLMELEVVEPELFLRFSADATQQLVSGVTRLVRGAAS
ncbi:MAG: hypothetical protein HYV07_15280 [Deltaproteobacteria bacterium]|nr:hypothetical protein [Deltaproteobacteria bacterium]